METHEEYMRIAIEEAKIAASLGESPIGAVIVQDGKVVGRGHNTTETAKDPTCHAEMNAIRNAARNLGGWRLPHCSMYVTLEPCSMCAGAIVLARIEQLYIGTPDSKSGACGSLRNIVSDERLNHRVEVHTGVLQEECSGLLKDFFKQLRKKKNKTPEEQQV
ncbi:MAG: tRNA adenosine(34) deaminase TadA [Firmicutes bacterium]|nr:tRNA adenosine(34) deaminase TadA [Bacillota bacterium]